jgi:hypothetical protein
LAAKTALFLAVLNAAFALAGGEGSNFHGRALEAENRSHLS